MSASRFLPGAPAALFAVLLLALAGGVPRPAHAAGAEPGFETGTDLAAPAPRSQRFT